MVSRRVTASIAAALVVIRLIAVATAAADPVRFPAGSAASRTVIATDLKKK